MKLSISWRNANFWPKKSQLEKRQDQLARKLGGDDGGKDSDTK